MGSKRTDEHWGSRIGVILAVAGSAVGLGNFLRFPGQAAQNGGGAFMIPYLISLLILGIPICWAEWTMGRYGGSKGFHSCPGVMGVIGGGRLFRYFGCIGVLIPIVVYMYYVLIESWCLRYCMEYFTGSIDLGTDPTLYVDSSANFFASVTGSTQNGLMVAGGLHPSVIFWIITFILNFWLLRRGLSGGIETFCKWAMPTMAVCALIVLVRVLTLGTPNPALPEQSVLNGLGFMWNPQFEKLTDFSTWLAAAGQIFFSLSVGFGVIVNYASYLERKDDVVLSGLTSSATNELFEVALGGMITIPAAFVFLGATGATGSTFGLGFNTLPVIFVYMGELGRFVGGLWFLMLFLAAITSSLSMLQPVLAFLDESLGLSRNLSIGILAVVTGLGSFWCLYFSKGLVALDTMDFWVGTFLIFILATVQVIGFGWVFGIDRGMAEAHKGASMQIPGIFRVILKYVAPIYLLTIFFGFCYQNLPGYITSISKDQVATWTIVVIVMTTLSIVAVTGVGEARWRKEGLDLDGRLGDEEA